MKKSTLLLIGLGVIALLSGIAMASNQGNPSWGTTSAYLSSQIARRLPVDQNGDPWVDNTVTLGYKVFESSGSASAVLVKDEVNNAATSGLLHQICVSGNAGFAVAFDSNTTSGITANGGGALGPQVSPVSSAQTCLVVDAQFNNGLVLINSSAVGASYVYWRPARGGSN
jgi:hypothetical protein